jgi:hypothetical protein
MNSIEDLFYIIKLQQKTIDDHLEYIQENQKRINNLETEILILKSK